MGTKKGGSQKRGNRPSGGATNTSGGGGGTKSNFSKMMTELIAMFPEMSKYVNVFLDLLF